MVSENRMPSSEEGFLNEVRPLAERLIKFAMDSGKISNIKIEVSALNKQKTEIEKGEVSQVISGATHEVGVTLYQGNRMLSFEKNGLDEKALRDAITENVRVIHLVPENADKLLLKEKMVYKGSTVDLDLRDKKPPDQSVLIAYAREMEAAALLPGVKKVSMTSIETKDSQSFVRATNGLDSHRSETQYEAVVMVIAEDKKGKMQQGYNFSVARHFKDMVEAGALGKSAALKTVKKLSPTIPVTGTMDIVLNHDAAESFFEAVFKTIQGTAIHRDASIWKDKINQQVMSACITLVDDPRIPRGLASSPVDGVGLEAKEITFIKNGVLTTFDVNLEEANKLKIAPIGREKISAKTGGMTNARVLPGTKTPEELIRGVDGIFITGFNGGIVDVNNGTFSRQADGFLIENGVVTKKAVAGFVVACDLTKAFKEVFIANDTPKLPSTTHSLAAPTTLLRAWDKITESE
ncbi:MAG: TldD/PmbA family protein [Pseudomonadota bacterium]